jgi:tRNA(fMet)-specific endonuclease VapC
VSGPYLLDTNIISDIVRHPAGRVAARIREVGAAQVCTSIVVAAELRFGEMKRGSRRLLARVDAALGAVDILSLEPPADRFYGELRDDLERRGLPIGANDMLIAAHALAAGCTLVTNNEREFSRVRGLKVENWLRPLSN